MNQTGKHMNGSRCVLAALCVIFGVLIFDAGSGLGFETHLFREGFGPDGTSGTRFNRPSVVAVDQASGNLLVGEAFPGCGGCRGDTIEKFNGLHEPEPFTGIAEYVVGGEITGFNIGRTAQFAVDPSTHVFYVEEGGEFVKAYQPDGEPAEFAATKTHELQVAEVCGVAIDSNGDIYVGEFSGGIGVYTSAGELLTTIPQPDACNLAVDSEGTVYVVTPGNPEAGVPGPVQELVPSVFPVTSATTYSEGTVDPNPSYTVAFDSVTGRLYVDEGSQVAVYDKTGRQVGAFGKGVLASDALEGTGLAINDSSGEIYAAQSNFEGQVEVFGPAILLPDVATAPASEISPTGSVTLNGSVNPDGVEVTGCQFDYGPTDAYGKTVACEQAAGKGENPLAVTARLSGLEPGTTYHFRLQATNAAAPNGVVNTGSDQFFATPPRPSITGESIANLTSSSVDVSADANPNAPEGAAKATCMIAYGTTVPYEHRVECEPASLEGSVPVIVKQHIGGLEPNVTYHWRVVVTNEAGVTAGVDHTFIYDTTGEALPDNRAYEMVTPPEKNAALLSEFHFGIQPDISEDGSRLIISTVQCFAGAESCVAVRKNEVGVPFLFSRGSGGWTATGLTPPASLFPPDVPMIISANTGDALVSMPTPPMGEDDFYRLEPDGAVVDIGPVTPPAHGALGPPAPPNDAKILGTSTLSRVVYEESEESHGWPFDEGVGKTVYEYAGSGNTEPTLVGVSGGPGSNDLISKCGTAVGDPLNVVVPGMLSADGETVFFTASGCAEGGTGQNAGRPVPVTELFARIDEAQTVALSEPSAFSAAAPYTGCESEACVRNVNEQANWKQAVFAGASNDGSKVFFRSEQQLTDSATENEDNLYEAELSEDAASQRTVLKRLNDVSAGEAGGSALWLQGVVAISGDGSHVYFVAQGALTGAANAQGATAEEGADNLYLYEGGARNRLAFVARLAEVDSRDWTEHEQSGGLANVTPEGRYLIFESKARLTPDDTRTDGATQIFRYDASTGELVRVSVGERGWNDNGNIGAGDASIVPAIIGFKHAGASRGFPTMSEDGAFVFFESPVGLTPGAANDLEIGVGEGQPVFAENVYEWHDGRVSLISDGRDTAKNRNSSVVRLLGSDDSGANVFFGTADSLVPEDTDTQVDYYDARICTPASPCVTAPPTPPAPCLEEACHGTPSARPLEPTGGSSTLGGTGNVMSAGGAGEKTGKKKSHKPKRKKRRLAKCHRRRARGCSGRFHGMKTVRRGSNGRGHE